MNMGGQGQPRQINGSVALSRSVERRWPRVLWAVASVALVAGLIVSSAQAFHIAGATYTGTHSKGGTVEFRVSADGRLIEQVRLTSLPGASGSCTVEEVSWQANAPIENHAFDELSPGYDRLRGSFTGAQKAEGTFFTGTGCLTGTLSWSATTTASPAGTEECRDAQAAVDDALAAVKQAKKQVKQAKRQVDNAEGPEEKAKAKKKLKRAKRKLSKAKQQLEAASATQEEACGA